MRNESVDVLNLEWTSNPSRDREVVCLVTNYLRIRGLNVYEGPIFDGYSLIDRLKPKVLFMTNSVGASLNIDLIRYAKSKSILCITGMAEGNFNQEGIEQFAWGVNKKKVLYEDYTFLWNAHSLDLMTKKYPAIKNRVGITGAIGFDRYKICGDEVLQNPLIDRTNYKSVVGIGCWNFDFTIEGSHCFRLFNGNLINLSDLKRFQRDRELFNEELYKLVSENPQTLFLIKTHPGCLKGDFSSGIVGCRDLTNSIVIKNELSVFDCLKLCDLWITYESTTAVEAWLLGKPTALLNPSGTDFPFREGFHLGQPNYESAKEFRKLILSIEKNEPFHKFLGLEHIRNKLIRSMIQWDDGLNHIRMGNAILSLLNMQDSVTEPISISINEKIKKIKRVLSWKARKGLKLLPYSWIKKFHNIVNWDQSEVEKLSEKRMGQQKNYYDKNNLSEKDFNKIQPHYPNSNQAKRY